MLQSFQYILVTEDLLMMIGSILIPPFVNHLKSLQRFISYWILDIEAKIIEISISVDMFNGFTLF